MSCSSSSGRTAKASAVPSSEKLPPLPPEGDKVPVLLSSLPNESALVTDPEDDSDTNETLHDAETISDKAHAPMPPSSLSPRCICVGGPNSSSANPPRLPMDPCARRLQVGRPRRPRNPPYRRPTWVVGLGLQLISARSGQPRRRRLLLQLRSCIVVTQARAEIMSRMRVASAILMASWHLSCVIGSRVRLGAMI